MFTALQHCLTQPFPADLPTPQALSNLLWAIATLELNPPLPLQAALLSHAQKWVLYIICSSSYHAHRSGYCIDRSACVRSLLSCSQKQVLHILCSSSCCSHRSGYCIDSPLTFIVRTEVGTVYNPRGGQLGKCPNMCLFCTQKPAIHCSFIRL